jgi:glycosyltransferase involved in cell wall biosynthesis
LAFTVSNTHSHYFNNFEAGKLLMPIQRENEFRFLSLCSFAKNKNLEILNQVIPILNEYPNDKKIKFVLTIDEKIFQEKFSIIAKNSIINLGRIDISECPQIYFECDALFSPTLLECFSANYPEAMKMDCPILTSDISFANSICNKAALYFNPLNAEDIAVKLLSLVESESLRNKLVEEGNIRLRSFHTSSERAKEYISICKKVSNING